MTTAEILSTEDIEHKIRRMAFQIYEANINESSVIISGIYPNGHKLAIKLKEAVEKVSNLTVTLCKLDIDKKNPIGTVKVDVSEDVYKNKSVILVDDVLNSGSTLIYAVSHFLKVPLQQFKTAVLVDRNHKKYPVKADYKGISLSTSINENVVVTFSPKMKVTLE